jgi:Exopolysaccharide biosynthesis protein YbjH
MLRRRVCLLLGVVISSVLTGSISGVAAQEFPNALSLQGFTGIMNTPTANVQKEGTLALWYANQHETRGVYSNNESYLFSVGLFSLLEGGGRIAQGYKDLSAQFKVTSAPFTPKQYPWFPTFAFGVQDVGGKASYFRSSYFVATEEINRFRLSLGYGNGPDRMEGTFGGVELKAFQWLYLLGEYDTKDTNIGARLVTPDIFGYPVNLQASVKSAVNNHPGNIDFSVGFQFALGQDWHRSDVRPVEQATVAVSSLSADGSGAVPAKAGVEAVATVLKNTPRTDSTPLKAGATAMDAGATLAAGSRSELLCSLRDKLVADGFMNVRVGAHDSDLLVIEYENARYTQSQLDGMGVVLGMVVKYLPNEFKSVRLVLKVQNLSMIQVTVPVSNLGMFFRNAGMNDTLRDLVAVSYTTDDNLEVSFVEERSAATWFRSRLTLAPRLKTFVATEVRTLDYLLTLAPSLMVDLWKGAVLNASADIPVAWSNGFDDHEPFRTYRNDPQFESLMLSQALRVRPDLTVSVSGGMISNEVYGTVNEAYWYSREGNHRLGFLQGFGKDNHYSFNRTAYLGSYRYTYTPLDASLTLTGGSFWDNDRGVRADLTRFWGDTSFSVFYKMSRTPQDENYQIGGVQVAFPLTPRQGMKPYPVQVKGTDEWSYRLQTVTKSPDGTNSVFVSIGETPPVQTIPKTYYDRDRLTPEYIKTHLLRVRDAYLRYVQPE